MNCFFFFYISIVNVSFFIKDSAIWVLRAKQIPKKKTLMLIDNEVLRLHIT